MSSSPSCQIIYTVIVRNKEIVLSDYTAASGNFNSFVLTVLKKVQAVHAKKSFQYDKYGFHILNDDNFAFVLMTDQEFKLRVAFACLDDIRATFYKQYTENVRSQAISYGLQNDFTKFLRLKVDYYNSPESDKLTQVKANIDATKNIMMENLDKLLERGEKLEILVQKTEHMVQVSTDMKRHATQIRRDMWWRNKKMLLLLILVVLIIIYVILIISCGGFALKRCT